MDYSRAQQIAGDLYGKILLRNADPSGFSYVVEKLISGANPLDIASEFMKSEEFADKFLLNTTINEISRKTLIAIFGIRPSPEEIKLNSVMIGSRGFQVFVDKHIKNKKMSLDSRIPDFRDY